MEGHGGEKSKEKEGREEGKGKGEERGIPLRMKILATALVCPSVYHSHWSDVLQVQTKRFI